MDEQTKEGGRKFGNIFRFIVDLHYVESVPIRRYSGLVEILCMHQYSVRMQKNADQNNSEY